MPSRPVSKSPLKNMVRRLRDLAHIMDSEKSVGMQEHLPGYPSLASFIASDPDQTSAIYKRFDRLASRHLLHLQSQLAELEAEQDRLDREQHHEDLNTKQYSRNWTAFCNAAAHDARQKRRKELAEEIGRTLKDYREYNTPESR
jgi:vacuolar-type H+-ATPase subunit I/STV1